MRALVARRLLQAAVIVAIAATVAFLLVQLAPGDPLDDLAENPRVPPEVRAQIRARWGLDRPMHEQYALYLRNLARGDLGWSLFKNRPVADAIRDALPNTLLLMGVALVGAFALGVTTGVIRAGRRGSLADRALGAGTLVFYSMPDFWLAIMAMLLFANWIPLFPTSGMTTAVMYDYLSPAGKLFDRLKHLVLPATTLVLLLAAIIARYQRAAFLDVATQDFVRTARAKGVTERAVLWRHILRNALLPVITLLGLALPMLVGGAVFIEHVFAWPGMGALVVGAIAARDHVLVVAVVIMGSGLVTLGSLLADVLYAVADPRLRLHSPTRA
ncbi:MAG TPA: ABC transporter permease [Gemmatimonadaceae bacterium]|nr:ABC transporter permease [Gemmatimonadaceae bacterium]